MNKIVILFRTKEDRFDVYRRIKDIIAPQLLRVSNFHKVSLSLIQNVPLMETENIVDYQILAEVYFTENRNDQVHPIDTTNPIILHILDQLFEKHLGNVDIFIGDEEVLSKENFDS